AASLRIHNVAIKVKVADRRPAARPSRGNSRSTRPAKTRRFSFRDPLVKLFFAGFVIACAVLLGVFSFFYIKYDRLVDRRMAGGVFSNAAKIYARPRSV